MPAFRTAANTYAIQGYSFGSTGHAQNTAGSGIAGFAGAQVFGAMAPVTPQWQTGALKEPGGPQEVALEQAVEVDTATAFGRTKTRALGQAAEADTAFAMVPTKSRALGQAIEADTATTFGRTKQRVFEQAAEADSGQAVLPTKSRALGQALSVEIAQPMVPVKRLALGQATCSEQALPMGVQQGVPDTGDGGRLPLIHAGPSGPV